MVRQRGQFTKAVGKFARFQNRHQGDSDDSDEDSDEEEEQFPNRKQSSMASDEDEDEDEDFPPGRNKGRAAAESDEEEEEVADGSDEEEMGSDGEPVDGDDLGEEDDDEEEEEEEERQKRKKSSFIDDAAEEEEEEEVEEDRRAGKKRQRFNLIDDEAQDDEDDEEDDDEDDTADLINDEEEEAKAAEQETRQLHAQMNNLDQNDAFQNEEDIERFIQERYGQRYTEHDDAEGTEVEQQAMLPTVKDPKLWMVKCRPGTEREVCVQLMQKFITMANAGTPLLIKSCLVQDHLKGYMYVEADKQAHVLAACKGLRNIFSFKGANLVPIGEMTEVMTIQSKGKTLLKESTPSENHYIRIRNGLYKGDLAQVVSVHYAENQAVVKLVPRVDMQAIKDK
eukprot:CAMPEP_0118942736 /NCGR_PEP_ID=MMETSP1169-20130426/36749_1 /TAXON_ID=36882 /ORGANISM="Pyramimonas obovata, Strain CCMP722" /LENGTH=394 /DNA_ID=CAMNT_0006887801 /DNA_START=105 /DNA_END=1286 /DNA_ORIENTATION=-